MSLSPENLPIYLQRFTVEFKNNSGELKYSNVGLLPTSTPEARSWVFNLQCLLNPQVGKNRVYEFEYNFSQVIFDTTKFVVNFNGPVQGFGFLGESKEVINLQRSLTYTYDFPKRRIFFTLRIPCSIQEPTLLFLNMYIDDSDTPLSNGFYLLKETVSGLYLAADLFPNQEQMQFISADDIGVAEKPNAIWMLQNYSSPTASGYVIANSNGLFTNPYPPVGSSTYIINNFLLSSNSSSDPSTDQSCTQCSSAILIGLTAIASDVLWNYNSTSNQLFSNASNACNPVTYLSNISNTLCPTPTPTPVVVMDTNNSSNWTFEPIFSSTFTLSFGTLNFPYTISWTDSQNNETFYLTATDNSCGENYKCLDIDSKNTTTPSTQWWYINLNSVSSTSTLYNIESVNYSSQYIYTAQVALPYGGTTLSSTVSPPSNVEISVISSTSVTIGDTGFQSTGGSRPSYFLQPVFDSSDGTKFGSKKEYWNIQPVYDYPTANGV